MFVLTCSPGQIMLKVSPRDWNKVACGSFSQDTRKRFSYPLLCLLKYIKLIQNYGKIILQYHWIHDSHFLCCFYLPHCRHCSFIIIIIVIIIITIVVVVIIIVSLFTVVLSVFFNCSVRVPQQVNNCCWSDHSRSLLATFSLWHNFFNTCCHGLGRNK